MLDKYGVPLYEEQMFEHILDQIMSPNTELKTEVKQISSIIDVGGLIYYDKKKNCVYYGTALKLALHLVTGKLLQF